MALIKCEECGKEISDQAGACPNCGMPKTKQYISSTLGLTIEERLKVLNVEEPKSGILSWTIIGFLGFIMLLGVFSCSGGGSSSKYHSDTKEDAEIKEVIKKLDDLDTAKEKNSHYY